MRRLFSSGYDCRALLMVLFLLVLPTRLMAEPCLWQIYNTVYGQHYVSSNQELEDSYGIAYDDTWRAFSGGYVVASARYADYKQRFGYYTDSCIGSDRVELFDVTESGYLPPGEYEAFFVGVGSNVVGFYLEPYTSAPDRLWFSQVPLNGDGEDHMRAFRAPDFDPETPEYLVAWEDLTVPDDADYNDLVLRVLLVEPYEVECRTFRLRYLHPDGADLNYHVVVTTKEQTTMLDMNRHINSNDGSTIDMTTHFSNARMIKRGVTIPFPQLNGPVCRTIMDSYGVVSSVQPLGSTKERFDAVNLSLERDIMNNLGISSFPERDLTVGSTWTKSGSKGNTQATFIYTIVEDEGSEAGYSSVVKIKIESSFSIDENIEVVAVRKTDYIKGNVSIKGMLYVDLDTGRIVRLDQTVATHASHIMVDFGGTAIITPNEDVVTTQLMIE